MRKSNVLICAAMLFLGNWVRAADNEIPKEVRAAFEKATEFDLYSLDPSRPVKKDAKDELLHDWKVLGKMTLKGDEARKICTAIDKGRKDSDGTVAACFNPRHAVRIVHDKKIYDIVICYECLSASVYEGDKKLGYFLTTRSPEKAINKALVDAKVPLPKSRDE